MEKNIDYVLSLFINWILTTIYTFLIDSKKNKTLFPWIRIFYSNVVFWGNILNESHHIFFPKLILSINVKISESKILLKLKFLFYSNALPFLKAIPPKNHAKYIYNIWKWHWEIYFLHKLSWFQEVIWSEEKKSPLTFNDEN